MLMRIEGSFGVASFSQGRPEIKKSERLALVVADDGICLGEDGPLDVPWAMVEQPQMRR